MSMDGLTDGRTDGRTQNYSPLRLTSGDNYGSLGHFGIGKPKEASSATTCPIIDKDMAGCLVFYKHIFSTSFNSHPFLSCPLEILCRYDPMNFWCNS